MELSGKISNIQRQQTVILIEGKRDEKIQWRVDFSFFCHMMKAKVYAEAKGIETGEYKLKLRLWKKLRPYRLEIYKGRYKTIQGKSECFPFLHEVINVA